MTLLHRSLVAIAISASLAGCYTDTEATVPMPENPEPMQPLPAEKVSLEIGDSIIDAMKESVVITTLEGEEKRVNVETFKGIEYATQTRFEHSEYAPLADEVDATKFGYACMQNRTTAQTQDEDCLNLNIWRPAGVEAGADLPVYVFIHGGDFEYGAGSEALVHGDTIVAQGADGDEAFIYVSFNYRLGLLGSHWVDWDESEQKGGNFGLGDQTRALEWVHSNIDKFGGSTDNITVMGQGSGAMSVGILQQDDNKAPDVNQYFNKAIMQSNPYGFEYKSYSAAQDIATKVCEDLGLSETIQDENALKSTLETLLKLPGLGDILIGDKSLEEIVDEMPDEVETVVCSYDASEQLKHIDKKMLLKTQSQVLANPINNTLNWLTDSILSISPTTDYKTPITNFMPFAPYIETNGFLSMNKGYHFASQPMLSDLQIPNVIGTNANEANSFGMLPSLTFLIPTIIELLKDDLELADIDDPIVMVVALQQWLSDESNQQILANKLATMDIDKVSTQGGVTAYGVVTQLFFGLGNLSASGSMLELRDYAPKSETELGGALDNMGQFKTLMNDTLFDGPNRHMAATNSNTTTLYHFDKKPSFNMWNYNTGHNENGEFNGSLNITNLIKTIGCISGACNGSELPFMFNKAMRFDGSEVHPNSGEKALMNEMSRIWFSQALFDEHQYYADSDNVLVIDGDFNKETRATYCWDSDANKSEDPLLSKGRLTGLEELELMPWQVYLK
ncbi:carboxylesterase family protein [Vibrio breoganii]|uniref:carboxylesterase family protein n=1 Tax=Vibrio breoganii TaxID=553239 RepID=UPI000C83F9DC|nr:carboxylesterase family protein [Vibrio breoganii]PMM90201.1 para-nitrobenzyl esterase [Vibrio breoganii]